MKKQLNHQKEQIIQNNTLEINENYNTRTNKRIHNYSPPSHENSTQRDTIIYNSMQSNKSQGQLYHSNENAQQYSSNQDNDNISSTLDTKLLQKELTMTKKNLKEALARTNIMTHTNSKLQHQNDILEQQTQKTEVFFFEQAQIHKQIIQQKYQKRCKELIEKLSIEQLKINELNFLNKQIQKELDTLRNENSDTTDRMKYNFEFLKKKYDDYVQLSESKNIKVMTTIKKFFGIAGQNDHFFTNKHSDHIQEIYQKFRKIFENIQNIIDDKSIDINEDEINILQELKNMAAHKDQENSELKSRIQQLQQDLDKESAHTKDVLPRYRESLEKLKQNSKLMREKIKELQDSKQQEKCEFEKKIKKIQLNYSQAEQEKTQFKNQLAKLNKIMDEEQKESSSLIQEINYCRKENGVLKKKIEEYKGMVEDKENIIDDLKKEISSIFNNQQSNSLNKQELQIQNEIQKSNQPRQSSYSPAIKKERDELDFYLSKSLSPSPSGQKKTQNRNFFDDSDSEDLDFRNKDIQNDTIREQNINPIKGKIQSQFHENPKLHQFQQKRNNLHIKQQCDDSLESDESDSPVNKGKENNINLRNRSKESIQNFMTFAECGYLSNNNTFISNKFEDTSNSKYLQSQKQNNRSKDLCSFSLSKQEKTLQYQKGYKENQDQFGKNNNSYGKDYSSNNKYDDSSKQSYQKNNRQIIQNNKNYIESEIDLLDEEINLIKQQLGDELDILNTDQHQQMFD